MNVDFNLLLITILVLYLAYVSNNPTHPTAPLPTSYKSRDRVDLSVKKSTSKRTSYRRELGASSKGSGYVYAWQDTDQPQYVKIGRAKDWRDRLNAFQTAVPRPIKIIAVVKVADPVKAEKIIHKKYEQYRVRFGGGAEWFKSDRRLLKYLKQVSDPIPKTLPKKRRRSKPSWERRF